MSILPIRSLHCFSIFQRSMIRAGELPLCEVLDSTLIAEAFQEDKISFGNAHEDVFTPAITLWAMVSQLLFSQTGRSCKAAAGRVVSLLVTTTGRVVAQGQSLGESSWSTDSQSTAPIRKRIKKNILKAQVRKKAWAFRLSDALV